MKAKYANKVWRLKFAESIQPKGFPQPLNFRDGEEFHIVHDVLYMQGHPVPAEMQRPIVEWIEKNPTKFVDDTRIF